MVGKDLPAIGQHGGAIAGKAGLLHAISQIACVGGCRGSRGACVALLRGCQGQHLPPAEVVPPHGLIACKHFKAFTSQCSYNSRTHQHRVSALLKDHSDDLADRAGS